MKKILISLVLIAFVTSLTGQSLQQCDSVRIFFRQGSFSIDYDFCENGKQLEAFANRFRKLYADKCLNIKRIDVVSSSAPEGSNDQNIYLSERRAYQIMSYISRRFIIDQSVFELSCLGINWQSLNNMVKTHSSHLPNRNEIINIIENIPENVIRNNVVVDTRQRQLMDLDGGNTWEYLEEYIFPKIRTAALYVYFEKSDSTNTEINMANTQKPNKGLSKIESHTNKPEEPKFSFKTNLLYDILLVPNIGLELNLGRKISLSVNWMYAWWKYEQKHYYWRTYGGDIEIRKWFGEISDKHKLTGYHFGVYAQLLTYDFMLKTKGYLGDKWSYGGGLSCGYSHPISNKLNIDFTLGIGYLRGLCKEYVFEDNTYLWQATKDRKYLGVTKAEISLVWLIGNRYKNKMGG